MGLLHGGKVLFSALDPQVFAFKIHFFAREQACPDVEKFAGVFVALIVA